MTSSGTIFFSLASLLLDGFEKDFNRARLLLLNMKRWLKGLGKERIYLRLVVGTIKRFFLRGGEDEWGYQLALLILQCSSAYRIFVAEHSKQLDALRDSDKNIHW